jgi:hypothetical protein
MITSFLICFTEETYILLVVESIFSVQCMKYLIKNLIINNLVEQNIYILLIDSYIDTINY